jgi:hypothetical protein
MEDVPSNGFFMNNMQGHTDRDGGAAFRFHVEAGEARKGEEPLWQSFERRQMYPDEKDFPNGIFRLIYLRDYPGEPNWKVSVVLAFRPAGRGRWRSLKNYVHYTLSGLASGASDGLGIPWALMVVATAHRLFALHTVGRAGRKHANLGEMVHGNKASKSN